MSELKAGSLKKVLNLVKPALSSKDFIPIFSHFCFDADKVTAYSDPIGIQATFNSGITGGIKGDTFLSWVNALPESSVVTFDSEGSKIKFKSGRSRLEMACTEKEDFIFQKPNTTTATKIDIGDEFVEAIEHCSLSVNTNSDNPSMSGITISRVEDTIFFHSTNGLAISEYTVTPEISEYDFEDRIILPATFCNVLKKLYKELGSKGATVSIGKDYALVTFSNSDSEVELWTKLLDVSRVEPLDFDAEISNALNGFDMGATFDVTETMISTMARLLSVYNTSTNEAKLVNISANENELNLSVKKGSVHLDESIQINGKQPKLNAIIDLESLLDALHPGSAMAMLPNLVLVTSERFTYLQAYKHE